jgi:uncharacterized protein YecE (DUF72 family)
MEVWIGTSGYSYADWVGEWYPRGTPAKRMLAHYARQFPVTELNFTYYRMPTAEMLARQAQQTPPGFQFAVKLFQDFTHKRDLTEAASFRAAIDVLHREGRLCALLAQFPQQFHNDNESSTHLETLAERFAGYPLAVEFRHRSWAQPEITEWLRTRGLHLVSVDVPPIHTLFPTGLVQSNRTIYIRFHSRNADAWYAGEKSRYDYLYTDAELTEWLDVLRSSRAHADRAFVLFNNCHRGQAAHNAVRMQELLKRANQFELRLVEPPEDPGAMGEQGLLF